MKRNNTATGNPHILLTAMGIQRDHWESRTLSTKSTKNHRTPKQTTKQNKKQKQKTKTKKIHQYMSKRNAHNKRCNFKDAGYIYS